MRGLIRALAVGRVVFGSAMLFKPEEAVRGWIGQRAASYGGTQAVTQACGVRDLALGAGALGAFVSGRDARDWVVAGACCDVVDLVATLKADDVPVSGRVMITVLASAAIAVSAGYLTAGSSEP
jgi:hypothetical protein